MVRDRNAIQMRLNALYRERERLNQQHPPVDVERIVKLDKFIKRLLAQLGQGELFPR